MRRLHFLLLLLAFTVPSLLPACGGGGGGANPFVAIPPTPPPGNQGGGGTTPPPLPTPGVTWNADAFSYQRVAAFGSFPSSLVRHGDTLFASDADQIEGSGAVIHAIHVGGQTPVASTAFSSTLISPSLLLDSGGNAASLSSPIGFGFFLNEIHIVSDALGLVLVNAGGSDNVPNLSNLVAFDPRTGQHRGTVNLARSFTAANPLFDSTGTLVAGNTFTQSQGEGIAYVPVTASTGLLYVCMANIVSGAPSFGSTKLPGTVQVYAVNLAVNQAVATTPAVTLVTQGYNPVAAQAIETDLGGQRLLVTCAGTTGFDQNFNLVPLTGATVEAFNAFDQTFLGRFDLGLVGLSAIPPALGADAAGQRVGFFPSSVTGEVYLLLLEGLYTAIVDPTQLAVLRGPQNGIPVTAAQSGSPGGNITGVALSPDGATLVVSGFGDLFAFPTPEPGKLFLLSLPSNLISGSGFGSSFVPGSTEFASTPGRTLGEIVIRARADAGPEVFVNVGGALDGNFAGADAASLGTLDTAGLIR